MVVVGGTATRARVEGGKQRGNVAWRNDQGRRNRGIRSDNDRSRVWSGDDYRDVVVRCVRKTNCRNRLSSLGDSRSHNWEVWDQWQFLMSSYVADNGSGRGSLKSATCLNKEGLKSSHDVGCNELVEYMVAAGL